jgi:hypothetical protein
MEALMLYMFRLVAWVLAHAYELTLLIPWAMS